MFTSGYELTTAITNLMIFIISLYGFIKIKNNKLWKLFYMLMSIDSFLGCIVHGISFNETIINVLWVILSILFTITVNTLLCIFLKFKYKYAIILSVLLSILLISFILVDLNFILAFIIYVIISFVLIGFSLVKKYKKKNNLFIISFIVQFVGGIFLLCKAKLFFLDYNGICHLFTVVTLLLFYIGIKKNN